MVQKCSHHLAPCHTLHLWWAALLHLALALLLFPRHDLLQLPLTSFPAIIGYLRNIHNLYRLWAKHLAEHQDLAEHEDLRVKPLFFHRPSFASTCDSAESIATPPPESDLDNEQIRALLASPLYCRSEKQMRTDRNFITLQERKTWCQVHLKFRRVRGDWLRCLQPKTDRIKKRISTEDFSSGHQQVLGNSEPLFRFSHPDNSANSLLEGHRDHMLAEAKSEILEQEGKVEFSKQKHLWTSSHSHRLEVDGANCGYEQPRREQADNTKNCLCEKKSTSRYSCPKYPWNGTIEESSGNASWWILHAKI